MLRLSDQDVEAIARKIVGGISTSTSTSPAPQQELQGIYPNIDEAVKAAGKAQPVFVALPLKKRMQLVAKLREVLMENASALAKAAYDETGLGRFEDKIVKNQLVVEKTPGPEELKPKAVTGDHGMSLIEPAPFGVIGAITPCTNPTSTIICNTIGMISAGNTVVFNVHPTAKNCSMQTIAIINKTIIAEGGPPDIITGVANPTIESAQELMTHPGIRLLVVTGGGGVVQAAMNSGKRAICAGPGNPPVVVDETADLDQAAQDIVMGASTDNNIICVDEKEVFVVESVADELMALLKRHHAYQITASELQRVENLCFKKINGPGKKALVNPECIGKNASEILGKVSINVPDTIRLGVVEVDESHPFVWTEQMMPILPIVRVPDSNYGIDIGIKAESKCRHTAVMHSRNIDRLHRMARECNCSIFVKNGRSVSGLGLDGEGHTSFTIASPTGEGLTSPITFSRWRRCTLKDHFRIV